MMRTRHLVVLLVICCMLAGPLAAVAGALEGGRAGPDLAIRPGSYGMVPASPRVGDEVTSNVTVENRGDTDIDGNFTVTFYLNDTDTPLKPAESNVTFGGIAGGESYNVSLGWSTFNLASGVNYTVLVIVDVEGWIAESDETNNRLEQNITFLPRLYPDLSVSSSEVWFEPSPPAAGDNITVTVLVRNQGDAGSRFVDVFFYLNDTDAPLSGFVPLRDINVSESKNASTVWDARALSPGRYNILIFVNPRWSQNFHAELDTSNNNLTVPVELGRKVADLAIRGLGFQPQAPRVGELVEVTVEVSNAGNASSPECALRLFPGYELDAVAAGTVPALQPGGSASVVLDWNTTGMPSGFNRMRVVVDPDYSFTDTNRTNNSLLWNLTLTGEVDMALGNLTISPQPARPGDNVSFTVSVRNLGSLRCNSANLTLRVRGTEADRTQLMTLAAGGVMNATLRWTTFGLSPGTYDYELSVAAGPQDNDTRPSNNILGGQLTLLAPAPRADLRVKDLVLPAQPPRAGDQLAVGVVIENAGDLEANASTVMVTLETAAGMVLRFTDTAVAVPAVSAGQAVLVNLTGDTARFAPGNYTLNVSVDYGSAVDESNESNNHLAKALTILEPLVKRAVLSVGDIFFAGQRREGEKVDVIVSIGNTGDDTALNVVVTFMIDGKVAATQNLDQIAAGTSRNATLTWTFAPGDHPVKAVVASTGLSDVSGQRTVRIESAPSNIGNYLLVAALAMVLLLVAAVLVWAIRRPKQPGPKVKLVEEEE